MRHSSEIDLIAPALVRALPKIDPPARTRTGYTADGDPYQYADLADVLAAAKGPLAENGIVLMQESVTTAIAVTTTTLLLHESGQFYESEPLELPRKDDSVHEAGGLITYGRRYQAEGMLGMSAQHDSDAASAASPQARGTRPASPQAGDTSDGPAAAVSPSSAARSRGAAGPSGAKDKERKPTQAQTAGIRRRLEKLGWDDAFTDAFVTEQIGKTTATTFDEASKLIDALEAQIKKQAAR